MNFIFSCSEKKIENNENKNKIQIIHDRVIFKRYIFSINPAKTINIAIA